MCVALTHAIRLQYTAYMKIAFIPQTGVDQALRDELEQALGADESMSEFVANAVRRAVNYRKIQTAFHAQGMVASEEFHRTGAGTPAEEIVETMKAMLDARRKQLGL